MSYSISKMYDNYKTTIPKPVRNFLELKNGDELIYKIDNNIVTIRKNIKAKKKDRFGPL